MAGTARGDDGGSGSLGDAHSGARQLRRCWRRRRQYGAARQAVLELGMSPGLALQFVPIVLRYVQSGG